jgi:Tfp pilus assembly PilM family ATPase
MEVAHDGDAPEVIRMGLCPVSADIITSYASGDPTGMAELLRELWVREGFGRREVVIAPAQDWVGIEPLPMEDYVAAGGGQGWDPAGIDWLPIPLELAVVDAQPISSTGRGQDSAVLVVAAERSRVLAQCALLKLAGLAAGVVDVSPIALRNALIRSHPEAGEGCVAAVDLGHETARVLLLREGVPMMVRQLPTGPLPTDFQVGRVGEDQVALAAELCQIMDVALDSYRPAFSGPWSDPDAVIGQIFVAGGGFLVPGMIQTLAEVAGVPVRRVQPFEAVAMSPTADIHGLTVEQDILFLQALGLALRRH